MSEPIFLGTDHPRCGGGWDLNTAGQWHCQDCGASEPKDCWHWVIPYDADDGRATASDLSSSPEPLAR